MDERPLSAGADSSRRSVRKRSPLWADVDSAVPHEETLSRAVVGMDADTGRVACKWALLTSRERSERPRLFIEGFAKPGAVHGVRTGPIGVEDGREIEPSPRYE